MKRFQRILIIAFAVCFIWSQNSQGGEAELIGALIGAGGGAIVGHAAGGTPESIIIGTAIGGSLGAVAGHIHRRGGHYPPPPFFLPPIPPPPYHGNKGKGYHHRRHHEYDYPLCKVVTKRVYRQGHSYVVTKEICNDDGRYGHERRYRNHHNWNRHYR